MSDIREKIERKRKEIEERKAQDLLLNRLPWGYSTVKFAWMPETLHIEWP